MSLIPQNGLGVALAFALLLSAPWSGATYGERRPVHAPRTPAALSTSQPTEQEERWIPMSLALRILKIKAFLPRERGLELQFEAVPTDLVPFVPEEATFVASVTGSEKMVGMFSVELTIDDLFEAITVLMRAEGYRTVDSYGQVSKGGFRRSPEAFPLSFCKETETMVSFDLAKDVSEPLALAVSHWSGSSSSYCSTAKRLQAQSTELPLPTLFTPPGVEGGGGGGSSRGQGFVSVGGSFETELTAADLMTYFTPQMLDQGWVAGAFADLGGFTLQTFSLIDERGARWIAMITVADPIEGQYRTARLAVRHVKALD